MARVNVDQKALSDPRFDLLARLMNSGERDLALGRMVRVWNECIERETPTPPRWVIETIFASPEACNWLVESELAENPVHDADSGTIRIKGTDGRIEWLSKKRRNGKLFGHLGASHGAKGGRPQKTPTPGFDKPVSGDTGNPPPAPAPAPAPALKENPLPPLLDTPEFREAWTAWESHRREIKKKLTPTSSQKQIKTLAAMGHDRAVRCIEHTIEKGWTGLREPDLFSGSMPSANGTEFMTKREAEIEAVIARERKNR